MTRVRMRLRTPNYDKGQIGKLGASDGSGRVRWVEFGEERHGSTGCWCGPGEYDVIKRVQRQRTKGWRMPDGALYVGRGTRWGNPFGGRGGTSYGPPWHEVTNADPRSPVHMPREVNLYVSSSGLNAGILHAVELYRSLATVRQRDHGAGWYRSWLAPLVGKALACWCPLDQPCHADVLLELANAEEVEADDL